MKHFKRNISVKDGLDLGIDTKMWFGISRKSIEGNDGDRDFYLSEIFGKKILEIGRFANLGDPDLYFNKDFYCAYWDLKERRVIFSFRLVELGDGTSTKAFYTRMRSGQYSWNSKLGGTRHDKIPKPSRRKLYKQLYDHFLTKL